MRYSAEQAAFIREVSPGRYNDEIATLFNEKFNTSVTAAQIKNYKSNHKIQSNVPKKRKTDQAGIFSLDHKEFIRENAVGKTNEELKNLLNRRFETSFSTKQVKAWKNRNHINSGLTGFFEKGHEPINKGTKGLFNVGGNSGSFKKGRVPQNYKPIGYERIDRDGYCLIKVQDHGTWPERWRPKHRWVWEQENGPVPEGHTLLFADGNKQHIELDNLLLISKKQLVRINQNGWIGESKEITEIGLSLASLTSAIATKVKNKKKRSDMDTK